MEQNKFPYRHNLNSCVKSVVINQILQSTKDIEDDTIKLDNQLVTKFCIVGKIVQGEHYNDSQQIIIDDGTGCMNITACKKQNKIGYQQLWEIDYDQQPYVRAVINYYSYYNNETKKDEIKYFLQGIKRIQNFNLINIHLIQVAGEKLQRKGACKQLQKRYSHQQQTLKKQNLQQIDMKNVKTIKNLFQGNRNYRVFMQSENTLRKATQNFMNQNQLHQGLKYLEKNNVIFQDNTTKNYGLKNKKKFNQIIIKNYKKKILKQKQLKEQLDIVRNFLCLQLMDQNKEDQSEKQKAFNFYVTQIDGFTIQIKEQFLELQKPLCHLGDIQLKESSKAVIFKDKKQVLSYLCLQRLCHVPNINVTQLYEQLYNNCNFEEQKYISAMTEADQNISDLLMQILESKNFVKNKELSQNILNVQEVVFWMPRESLLRDWNTKDLRLVKQIYNFRKLQQKNFQKMIEMAEKKEKTIKKNQIEQGLEALKKTFDSYQTINIKLKHEQIKVEKKVHEYLNPKSTPKKIKNDSNQKKQKQKEPQNKNSEKQSNKKTKRTNNNKIQSKNIETFFDKPSKKETKKTQKYDRWESFGAFPYQQNIKKVSVSQQKNSFNVQDLKKLFKNSKKIHQQNLSQYRLSKIEDFKKYTKEYHGIFTHNLKVTYDQQYDSFDIFNYELSSQEEIQHEEADTIKSDEKSADDDIVSEMKDFLVDDEYISGGEDDSEFKNFKVKNFASGNKDFKIYNLEENPIQELMPLLEAVNLTNQQYPIIFEKKKDQQYDPELEMEALQKLVLDVLGCASKKVIQQIIEQKLKNVSSKDLLRQIKEEGFFVYYVKPIDVEQYCKNDYFELLEKNVNQENIELDNYTSFMEYLITLVHGLSNSAVEKEERLYKKLKKSYYQNVSKSHVEKSIKAISKFGFMVPRKFLKKLVSQKEYI